MNHPIIAKYSIYSKFKLQKLNDFIENIENKQKKIELKYLKQIIYELLSFFAFCEKKFNKFFSYLLPSDIYIDKSNFAIKIDEIIFNRKIKDDNYKNYFYFISPEYYNEFNNINSNKQILWSISFLIIYIIYDKNINFKKDEFMNYIKNNYDSNILSFLKKENIPFNFDVTENKNKDLYEFVTFFIQCCLEIKINNRLNLTEIINSNLFKDIISIYENNLFYLPILNKDKFEIINYKSKLDNLTFKEISLFYKEIKKKEIKDKFYEADTIQFIPKIIQYLDEDIEIIKIKEKAKEECLALDFSEEEIKIINEIVNILDESNKDEVQIAKLKELIKELGVIPSLFRKGIYCSFLEIDIFNDLDYTFYLKRNLNNNSESEKQFYKLIEQNNNIISKDSVLFLINSFKVIYYTNKNFIIDQGTISLLLNLRKIFKNDIIYKIIEHLINKNIIRSIDIKVTGKYISILQKIIEFYSEEYKNYLDNTLFISFNTTSFNILFSSLFSSYLYGTKVEDKFKSIFDLAMIYGYNIIYSIISSAILDVKDKVFNLIENQNEIFEVIINRVNDLDNLSIFYNGVKIYKEIQKDVYL